MVRKKKPPPLQVSLHRIEQERLNVARRTQTRIAALAIVSHDTSNFRQLRVAWHSCLNMFCFYLLLVIANLLFCQWLYIHNKVIKL
jgi:hypothetical protein